MEEGGGHTSPPSPPPPPPPSTRAATRGVAGVGNSPSSPLESSPSATNRDRSSPPPSPSSFVSPTSPTPAAAGVPVSPSTWPTQPEPTVVSSPSAASREGSTSPHLSHSASRKPAAAEGGSNSPPSPTPPSPVEGDAIGGAKSPSLPSSPLRSRSTSPASLSPAAPPTGAPFDPRIDLKENCSKISAMEREEEAKRRKRCGDAGAMFKPEAVLKEEEEVNHSLQKLLDAQAAAMDRIQVMLKEEEEVKQSLQELLDAQAAAMDRIQVMLKEEEEVKRSLQELLDAHAAAKARIDNVRNQVEKDEIELEQIRLVEREAISKAEKIRIDAENAKDDLKECERRAHQFRREWEKAKEMAVIARQKEQIAKDGLRDSRTERIVVLDHTRCMNGRIKDIADWTKAFEEREKELDENRCKRLRLLLIFLALGIVHFCLFWVKYGLKRHEEGLGSSVGWIEGCCYVLVLSVFIFCKCSIDTWLKIKPDRKAEWASVTLHALSRFIFEGISNTAMGGFTISLVVAHLSTFGVEVICAMIFQVKFKIGSTFESFDVW